MRLSGGGFQGVDCSLQSFAKRGEEREKTAERETESRVGERILERRSSFFPGWWSLTNATMNSRINRTPRSPALRVKLFCTTHSTY